MSNEATGQQALDLLRDIIKKLGNWPLLEGNNWKESDFDWIDFTIETKNIGLNFNNFLDFETLLYPEKDKLLLKYQILIPPQEFKRNISSPSDPLIIAYKNYITKASALMYKQGSSEEIDEIIEFERKISEIHLLNPTRNQSTETTLEKLNKKFPLVNWHKLIDNVILSSLKTSLKISEITLMEPSALSTFIELLEKTPKRVQKNYALWKIIQSGISYLTEECRELKRKYCLTQNCKNTTRALSCVGVIKRYLGPAVNLLYAKNYYSSDIDKIITDMIVNIKSGLIEAILNTVIRINELRNRQIETILNTQFVIGYAEKNKSDLDFVQYYENLEIDTSNYFQTLLNLELFDIESKFDNVTSLGAKNLIDPVETLHPVNTLGRIDIPMAMLQNLVFGINYPMYMNYAYVDSAIIKELAENIMNLSMRRSKMTNENIYSKKILSLVNKTDNSNQNNSRKKIDDEVKPLSQWSHSNHTYEEIRDHVLSYPRQSALSKILVYKISYLAYQQWVAKNGIKNTQSELSYTNNQLFWIHTLQNACEDPSHELKFIYDKYTVSEIYLMKILTEFLKFIDDFECPIDSYPNQILKYYNFLSISFIHFYRRASS
ncbi:neprilysin-2 [Microplitis demolitor]|uniref:neprilysin-2 n=1 Tax=Microplitis demolitor TaxID=69319 RepID=UPI0004CCDFC5|nr:neprilysin-2 [Microplitis demolitor]XP_053594085.1 neprilysin-2 [Microplitis demolitor]XP_053594086.1 neprilysin-2 [Microplitis demolitor]XP_053594087.1 neprilysin-2 [Microplitis demolitor]